MKPTKILTAAVMAAGISTAAAAEPAPAFTLHEWGTFTTVSGSDGALLPGLEREEESLPGFVENLDTASFMMFKGFNRPVSNVFVKMETPVIYFYTGKPFEVDVDVRFHGGSINQWYPSRSGGETLPPPRRDPKNPLRIIVDPVDFGKTYEGSIQWKASVIPAGEDQMSRVFKPGETPTWIYPRQTASALVKTPGGMEKYLFYRGLAGKLPLPFTASAPGNGSLRLQNNGAEPIPGIFVLDYRQPQAVRTLRIDSLKPGGAMDIDLTALEEVKVWGHPVMQEMCAMLVDAGLYRQEADAMMQTWWNSYFARPGLRVFWILPRQALESILPLKCTPAPEKSVRVIVGRSEVLTPEFEDTLVSTMLDEKERNRWTGDRYFGAYEARVEKLTGKRFGGPAQKEPKTAGK